MNENEQILVAINCLVYNHEPYLRQCLDGFVMQKTNFRYVAIVHDDKSMDDSAAIIREYESKYPDIIKPIYETENQWSKHDGSLDRIMNDALAATGCKYIALCEGDDYWTDPMKLQKQVDFLENHPDFAMCCHAAKVLNETSRKVDTACERMTTREYIPEDAFPKWQIPTASIMYRREPVMAYPIVRTQDFTAGDVVLILRCMHVGRVWGMEDEMSVYRMNAGGVTSQGETQASRIKMCRHYEALMLNFPKLNKEYCYRYIAMVYYTKFRKENNIKDLWTAFKARPQYVMQKLLHIPARKREDLFYKNYGC